MKKFNFYINIILLAGCVSTQAETTDYANHSRLKSTLIEFVEPNKLIAGFNMPKIIQGKVSDGLDGCYTEWMQWFEDSLNCIGKVSYIPDVKGRSVLVFSFKDNGCKLTEELKREIPMIQENARKQYGKKDFALELGSIETIWTNNNLIGDLSYSLIAYTWDNLEEADVISISFPLHACKHSRSSRTSTSAIKKCLRNEIFTDIVLYYDSKTIAIPVDYRFNDIYREMYRRFK